MYTERVIWANARHGAASYFALGRKMEGVDMLPVKSLRLQLGELLGADTTTLAPVAGNKMFLIKTAFAPAEDIVLADLAQADFDGSTPIVCGTGTQPVGIDPATFDQKITIKAPAGGFRWETTGITHLPQVIYGYGLMDNAGTVLLAMAVLPTPLSLQEAGQEINLGSPELTIVSSPIS